MIMIFRPIMWSSHYNYGINTPTSNDNNLNNFNNKSTVATFKSLEASIQASTQAFK